MSMRYKNAKDGLTENVYFKEDFRECNYEDFTNKGHHTTHEVGLKDIGERFFPDM